MEALRCFSTGVVLQKTLDILQETHSVDQGLCMPDSTEVDAISTLLERVPNDAKLTPSQVTVLVLAPSDSDMVDLLQHSPVGKTPWFGWHTIQSV
ncbi:hypothetical protein G6F46_011252 [Rhizopus delemar]|uniref:Uncharacterized protein n=3 Tax=Rhizopus TaxID=4842 RepID=I1CIB4_RHIO9|nr:hypothetical protein RO3G_12905 [Rhizopus delemar RA 99-880]KAG1166390.1 hypothetical protein G6F36_012960 [Rhizopus arrhizus]KAG1448353.1 hypothetical protein G6F55_010687 [Rhizopus delemar]KAG1490131.1 hypothetical protein G6F54_010949 [Rhizopus delemar]KAG1501440.1 hypothetical protein G6F53_011082 [Rhizopus delemar]|eukprot:EIE88194.1 hypothetical protein RO3G_12905 [Rhizopus delemar RA 99-880]